MSNPIHKLLVRSGPLQMSPMFKVAEMTLEEHELLRHAAMLIDVYPKAADGSLLIDGHFAVVRSPRSNAYAARQIVGITYGSWESPSIKLAHEDETWPPTEIIACYADRDFADFRANEKNEAVYALWEATDAGRDR